MDNLPVIVVRFALYADLMVLAGMVAFSFYALTRVDNAAGVLPLATTAIALSSSGFLLSALGMLALDASMIGSSPWAVDLASLREIIGETAIGTAWTVRMAAMTVAILCALTFARSPTIARVGLLVSTALAIATLVWTGHAGATEGWVGTGHRVSDIVHMLAAAVWIGGIAAFSWILFHPAAARSIHHLLTAHRALDRFSRAGTLAVGLIVATGIINCLAVVGFPHITQLPLTAYGRLLIIKLLLFAAMLGLAALNRWRLTPALSIGIRNDDPASVVIRLRRSLAAEGGAALAILGLVAWLGTLDPLNSTG